MKIFQLSWFCPCEHESCKELDHDLVTLKEWLCTNSAQQKAAVNKLKGISAATTGGSFLLSKPNFPTFLGAWLEPSCSQRYIKRPSEALKKITTANYFSLDDRIFLILMHGCYVTPLAQMKQLNKWTPSLMHCRVYEDHHWGPHWEIGSLEYAPLLAHWLTKCH